MYPAHFLLDIANNQFSDDFNNSSELLLSYSKLETRIHIWYGGSPGISDDMISFCGEPM